MDELHNKIKKAEEMFSLLKNKTVTLRAIYEKELGDLYNELMFDEKLKRL